MRTSRCFGVRLGRGTSPVQQSLAHRSKNDFLQGLQDRRARGKKQEN